MRYMDNRRSADSAIQTAEVKGERRGERRGLQKGLQKGRQEGLQKGQELERAKLVKGMYENGITIAKIVKSANLSETAVKRILCL